MGNRVVCGRGCAVSSAAAAQSPKGGASDGRPLPAWPAGTGAP